MAEADDTGLKSLQKQNVQTARNKKHAITPRRNSVSWEEQFSEIEACSLDGVKQEFLNMRLDLRRAKAVGHRLKMMKKSGISSVFVYIVYDISDLMTKVSYTVLVQQHTIFVS